MKIEISNRACPPGENRLRVMFLTIGCLLLLAPAISRAGVNTWTGGPPSGAGLANPTLVATAATDPSLVYAAYGSNLTSDIYRSRDGGRTWERLVSFDAITAIFVHPSSPTTLFVGGRSGSLAGVFKSEDGGLTWRQTLLGAFNVVVLGFAASPKDASTIYATTFDLIYRSDSGGNDWSTIFGPRGPGSTLSQDIAALILDPKDGSTLYAGGSDFEYPDYSPLAPFFRASPNTGANWVDRSAGLGESATVEAIAVDPLDPATIFVGLIGSTRSSVFHSGDGGASWTPAQSGMPAGADVLSLVMDPAHSKTLYAGTDRGVYRTTDGGESWNPIGQQLGQLAVHGLAFDASGRILHAGTDVGAFRFEIGVGALDVAAGAAGSTRVLSWDDDRASVSTLEESGNRVSSPPEGPFGAWIATAISEGADGLSRVLWVNGDGRAGLEIDGASGAQAAFHYAAVKNWIATDVAVARDGTTSLLWTDITGAMLIATVDSTGAATLGPSYGPYAGWSALAIAEGPEGSTWVLWSNTDGRVSISRHHARTLDAAFRFDAIPGWTAEDVAAGADGRPRLLRLDADGRAEISAIDAAGHLTDVEIYGNPGMQARRIAASADGLTRLLWTASDGSGEVWLLNADDTLNSQPLPPIPSPPATGKPS